MASFFFENNITVLCCGLVSFRKRVTLKESHENTQKRKEVMQVSKKWNHYIKRRMDRYLKIKDMKKSYGADGSYIKY